MLAAVSARRLSSRSVAASPWVGAQVGCRSCAGWCPLQDQVDPPSLQVEPLLMVLCPAPCALCWLLPWQEVNGGLAVRGYDYRVLCVRSSDMWQVVDALC